MKSSTLIVAVLLAPLSSAVWSYGGGGGSSSCDDPKFLRESPANNSVVSALTDFSFIASDTEAKTLTVKINGSVVPAAATPMPNGDLNVSVHLASAVTNPGRVQIAVDGKSKDGCAGFEAFYIEVKP